MFELCANAKEYNPETLLTTIAQKWAGTKNRETVIDAFRKMHDALTQVKTQHPRYFWLIHATRVSLRYQTRPLVLKPNLLTVDEESYFLPHVFNIRRSEARTDYIDQHGWRIIGTKTWNYEGYQEILDKLVEAAAALETIKDAPQQAWLRRLALGLRMHASHLRSVNNFYHAQLLRDRNQERLAGEPRVHSKKGTRTGDADYIPWNAIMRDEFDNANELIRLLESGGLSLVTRAPDKKHEDTFLLGPEFLPQVKRKVKIMRKRWRDVDLYFASPL